jgi:NAD(P)-dependent dehydrogenase (short-subunit alcohol dehydrogenase family)
MNGPEAARDSFAGRHVVVTGGMGALGGAVVRMLLQAGATCHVPDRAPAPSGATAARHERLRLVPGVDLTDEGAVRSFYVGLPRLWASIHGAGGFAMAPVEEVSAADFAHMMSTNALSAFLCSREAVRNMRAPARGGADDEGRGGRIVNVTAQPGVEPRRGATMTAYTASKAAVAALTEALAEEVAAEGIWVNAVAPSIMDTAANRAAMPGADFSRWPKVEDVAAAIVFLASPTNAAARGTVVKVYGRT